MGETNGEEWGKVMTLADSFTWFDWWRCVQVRTIPRTNKLCLVLKIWQSPTSEWEKVAGPYCYFPESFSHLPPAAPFSSKSMRYILVQWRRRKKIVLMIAELAQSNNLSAFFFLGHFVKVTTHLSKKKDTHTHIYTYDICQSQFLLARCQVPINPYINLNYQPCKHIEVGKFFKRSFSSFFIFLNCFLNPRHWYTLLHWQLPQRKK